MALRSPICVASILQSCNRTNSKPISDQRSKQDRWLHTHKQRLSRRCPDLHWRWTECCWRSLISHLKLMGASRFGGWRGIFFIRYGIVQYISTYLYLVSSNLYQLHVLTSLATLNCWDELGDWPVSVPNSIKDHSDLYPSRHASSILIPSWHSQ